MSNDKRIDVYLICNARYHDTDFARLELLKLLAEQEDIVVRVAEDYSNTYAIQQSRMLITYTCDLAPTLEQQYGLRDFLLGGGRWFALHGTAAIIEWVGDPVDWGGVQLPGHVQCPNTVPLLTEMLGARYVAHPAQQTIEISIADPSHPMVKGLEDFEVFDEPYYFDFLESVKPLLIAHYNASAFPYVREHWDDDAPRPQLFSNAYGQGEVMYTSLGHCRGKFDMQPIGIDVCDVERGAWDSPIFYELLRRGIRWGIGELGV